MKVLFYDDSAHSSLMQESTRSLGRTLVRSAQVEEGKGGESVWGVVEVLETGKRWWPGVGLISRLCVHFFLGFASRGSPISFPRSFKPIALSILPMI